MITVLKGSPSYSIDATGEMTITTTWMVMPDSTVDNIIGWLAFETEVEAWAGKVGDPYKKPKTENSREATSYDESEAFKVSDISFECVEGRTHYEVTFTNIQNAETMRMVGNVSAEINENNEKSKSVAYVLDLPSDDPLAVDGAFILSGTTVAWAGDEYLVESSSYQAESKTRYNLSITAKDMSMMQIGLTTYSKDAFGQKTASAVWRFSATAYADWTAPDEGSDATQYLGANAEDGYLITDVSAEPDGVLGYNVTINAKHVSKRLVKASRRDMKSDSGFTYNVEHTIEYQSDAESIDDFTGLVGKAASEVYEDAVGRVTEVAIDEAGRNDYNVSITTSNASTNSGGNSEESLRDQIDVSMSQGEFVLTPKMCGYFKGLSGEYYPINFPPKTTYSYTQSPQAIYDMSKESGGTTITEDNLLAAVKGTKRLGYDWVTGVRAENKDGSLTWLSRTEVANLKDLKKVTELKITGYVYAQPTMQKGTETLRLLTFEPWVAKDSCPIKTKSAMKQEDGRDLALHKDFINLKITTFEFSVSMNYKGKAAKILKRDLNDYYKNAYDYIKNPSCRSYKGTNIGVSETTDDKGAVWTTVTCTIQAIAKYNVNNIKGWNPDFKESYVKD